MKEMGGENMVWWEKTVEYLFVKHSVMNGLLTAPFDGPEEIFGDTLAVRDAKWMLIEFKKSEREISDEKGKFKDYERTKSELRRRDGHHLIIFGQCRGRALELRCRTFFSGFERKLEELFQNALDREGFKNYLETIARHKKSPAGGAGRGTLDRYPLVAGVLGAGTHTIALTLESYIRTLTPELEYALKLDERSMEWEIGH